MADQLNDSARIMIVIQVQKGEIAAVQATTYADQPTGAMQLVEREMVYPKGHHFRGAIGRLIHRVKQMTGGLALPGRRPCAP